MVDIREIRREDEPEWRRLWKDYLAFYKTERPEEIYRHSFDCLTDRQVTDYHGLMAFEGPRAIGLTHYIFHRHGWQKDEVCYLQDLYVDPDMRGTGAGRKLIEAVYAAADAAGRPSVYWLTQDFNTQARQLYDRIAKVTPFIRYVR